MAVWETEDEGEETSVPTRSIRHQRSFRTPSRKGSKKSRRSPTPTKSESPTPPSTGHSERISKRLSKDPTIDDTISILDPRRFTPTLHASLVSEILSLRRDQEEKLHLIESLEATLDTTRAEHEALQESSKEATKENRSLKRQLTLLEGGASSAMGELVRERDDAVDGVTEARKKLDVSQKKLRTQEEDSQRVHDQWAREKDEWDEERRRYEQRLHVSETRLKTVLEEIAAYHAAQEALRNAQADGDETRDDASIRTMSMTNSMRFSLTNSPGKGLGKSLADELNFDPYDTEPDNDGRESIISGRSGRHCRTFSRDSILFRMHNRNMSIDSIKRPGSLVRGKLLTMNEAVLEALEGPAEMAPPSSPPKSPTKVGYRRLYRDTGVQFSPPPSPKDKKWVRMSGPLTIQPPSVYAGMVSAAAQTMEPLSPPKTPQSPFGNELASVPTTISTEKIVPAPKMVAACTQTEAVTAESVAEPLNPPPLVVPMIAIHAPTNRPASSGASRLPPLFKDAGVQASLPPPRSVDSGMQTEEVLTERRMARLPPHLHPSAITSRPNSPWIHGDVGPPPMTAVSPEPISPSEDSFIGSDLPSPPRPAPSPVPPRNPRRLENRSTVSTFANRRSSTQSFQSMQSTQTTDMYPGNNDNGPLSDEHAPHRRPHRFSSLFAGFDCSSDDGEDFEDRSDNEFHTALSAPKPKTLLQSSSSTLSGASTSETIIFRPGPARVVTPETPESLMMGGGGLSRKKSVRADARPFFEKAPNKMRRAALIQSGIQTHHNRPKSPMAPEIQPPFPIPARASSRVPPSEAAETPVTPTMPNIPEGWARKPLTMKPRSNSIRKVRNPRLRRRGSRSPPPLSSPRESESGGLGIRRLNSGVATPRTDRSLATNRDSVSGGARYYKTQRARTSVSSSASNGAGEVKLPQQQAVGVVDAIAQTMVGEWMYKYVRKRKSFGVPDAKDDSGNDRHKRWVWLAPYERAVLWSSKQPTNGGALLGKPGRKLIIQSVLDVKDDNPAPKGVGGGLFDRSILILTPERALKFTATSSERHYLWLTALSFLAHSSQAVTDMATMAVPLPEPQHEPPPPPPKRKGGGIRDSIRLAKTKATPKKGDAVSPVMMPVPPIPEIFAPVPDIPEITVPTSPASDGVSMNHSAARFGAAVLMGDDIADGPFIPRFGDRSYRTPSSHGRRRSNTSDAPALPISSLRGVPGGYGSVPSSSHGIGSAPASRHGTADFSSYTDRSGLGSGDPGDITGMFGNGSLASLSSSLRPSETSSSRPSSRNMFEAIGTMRMEAFISPLAAQEYQRDDYNGGGSLTADEMDLRTRRRKSGMLRRQRTRSRGKLSVEYSRGANFNPYTADAATFDPYSGENGAGELTYPYDMFGLPSGGRAEEEEYFSQDPFKGF